jgi:hypothetical protein
MPSVKLRRLLKLRPFERPLHAIVLALMLVAIELVLGLPGVVGGLVAVVSAFLHRSDRD